ncbi:DUF4190 domain-containing protein [Mycobacterium talmoniae]|uniref:DUF4190 domain-containing protein n=1 Tax=Mycobacterium talmoniae TaxID=1858794 RepID=A0A1S1NG59_9MYCO|nr:DUF4190 domain-containing protein [Mycobacterium talmoniae]OHV03392.1 hypothetical protein BKN37_15195 [Mycobacterium talmoniae]
MSADTENPPPEVPSAATGKVNTLATLSVVFAFLFAPVGAALGHVALSQIRRHRQPGRTRAVIGVTTSYLLIVATVVVLAVWPLRDRGHPATTTPANGLHNDTPSTANVSAHTPRSVTATITVGGEPAGIAADPAAHTVYVTVSSDVGAYRAGALPVIDAATNTVTGRINIDYPLDVAVDSATHTAYVTGGYWGRNRGLSVIDTAAGVITATVDVSGLDIALDPAAHTAYVAGGGDHEPGHVSVVDLTTNTVTTTTKSDTEGPAYVAVDPATHTAYFTDWGGTVSVIDTTGTVTTTITTGGGPSGVAVDTGGHTGYVTNFGDGVTVIDTTTNTVTTTIKAGNGPDTVAIDSAAHTAYVTNNKDGTVSVIDTTTNTVTTTIKVGKRPSGVAVDSGTHIAYVANSGDGTVSVISPSLRNG